MQFQPTGKNENYIGERYYHPIYGYYTIIADNGTERRQKKVIIKFDNTGAEKSVFLQKARNTSVRDDFYKSKFGVGYLGNYKDINVDCEARIQAIWSAMMARCYNVNDKDYPRYGGVGVTVSEEWKCYANFLKDFISYPNYQKWHDTTNRYHLDKDLLQDGISMNQKVYSKETCVLIDGANNIALSQKDKSSCSTPFYGVYMPNPNNPHKFEIDLYGNGTVKRGLIFNDEYYAAIYRDYIYKYKFYNKYSMYNNVPLDDKYFYEAQKHRTGMITDTKDHYDQLYHLVDSKKQ